MISIGEFAFSFCSSLTSVTIPSNVTVIEKGVFYQCYGLTSVTIPCSVTSIDNYAFSGCSSLTSVTVDIDTPLPISENTFSDSYNATLYVPSGSGEAYEAAKYWTEFNDIVEINYKILTIGSSGYSTFCSTKAMDFSGVTDVKAYIATGFNSSTNKLVLTRATKVPAGEGLFIVGKAGRYEVPISETNIMYSNLLKGTTEKTTITNPLSDNFAYFTLRDGDLGTFFYQLENTTTLPAGTAYLRIPSDALSTDVKAIGIEFNDGMVDIEDIKVNNGAGADNSLNRGLQEAFDLSGQRRAAMQHGVNIVRGQDGRTRKMVVR